MAKRPLVGYRNEDFQGAGVTNPIAVATYERKELGNTDIPLTLHKKKLIKSPTFKEAITFLKKMYRAGYTKCVWICPTIGEVKELYTYDDIPLEYVDRYTFLDYIIISNLGDSVLVLYRKAVRKEVPVRNKRKIGRR
jgi:hypothetical protein